MHQQFQQTIHIPGALTADATFKFKTPAACQLVHVSGYCETQSATLLIGNSSDADAYLKNGDDTGATITAGTVTEFDRDDFVGDQYPNITKGTTVICEIGHGSECVDLSIVLTFTAG